MRITFILPGFIKIPIGGVKITHEYANRLSDRGHGVTLIYPLELGTNYFFLSLKKLFRNTYDKLTKVNNELYYNPNPSVNVLVVRKVISKYIPEGDTIIAVGWQTAEGVNKLPEIHGKKFYLLQSFETYFRNRKKILKTYHLPMQKIAISQWIIDELKTLGESGYGPLGNAINPDEFFVTDSQKKRPYHIMMLYHHHKIKGAKDGLAVLKSVKRANPNIKTVLIAPRKPIHKIPNWIKVVIRPSVEKLRNLYNSSEIFLHTSHWEGWPLPVMEAMACGCAVVATRNRGIQEYLVHQKNSLISDIGDVKSLTDQVLLLLNNSELNQNFSEMGQALVKNYSWDNIMMKLENILQE